MHLLLSWRRRRLFCRNRLRRRGSKLISDLLHFIIVVIVFTWYPKFVNQTVWMGQASLKIELITNLYYNSSKCQCTCTFAFVCDDNFKF